MFRALVIYSLFLIGIDSFDLKFLKLVFLEFDKNLRWFKMMIFEKEM